MMRNFTQAIRKEAQIRSSEALGLFRAEEWQVPFFQSGAKNRLSGGGNQCVSFGTLIPTDRGLIPAAKVEIGDTVIGGKVVNKWMSTTPVETFELICEGGFRLTANAQHPVMAKTRCRVGAKFTLTNEAPQFTEVKDLRRGDRIELALNQWVWSKSCMTPNDGYFAGLMTGDGCLSKNEYGGMGFTSADVELVEWVDSYLDGNVRIDTSRGTVSQLEFSDMALKEKMRYCWGMNLCNSKHKSIPQEVFKDKAVARDFIRGYTDTDGCVYKGGSQKNRQIIWVSASKTLLKQLQQLLLAFGVYATLTRKDKTLNGKVFAQWRMRARGPYADAFMHRIGTGLARKSDGYVFSLEEHELPKTHFVRIKTKAYANKRNIVGHTVDPTNTYVTAGIKSHNSGKSTVCAIETASAALRIPVNGPDGNPIMPFKWGWDSPMRNRPLLIWIIGLGEDHLAQTIYAKLFKPGLFSVVRDPETGVMRKWNGYDDPIDAELADKIEPAPPLIQPAHVKQYGWNKKTINLLDKVTLKNDTEICLFTSKGDVKQGDQVDLIWIDEDIEYPDHVVEWQARLTRWQGYLTWSSWPRTTNAALLNMRERARQQELEKRSNPTVSYFQFRFSTNPYLPPEEKQKTLEDWAAEGPDVLRARDLGEFVTDSVLMYPAFDVRTHGIKEADDPLITPMEMELRSNGLTPPQDWARFVTIDPGHSVTSIGFWAVPPPTLGDWLVRYDELYLRLHDAKQVSRALLNKVQGIPIMRIVMDRHFGQATQHSVGIDYREIYTKNFRDLRIASQRSGFIPEFSRQLDVASGILQVREHMSIRADGTPKLKIVPERCKNFLNEIRSYRKTIRKEAAEEKPASGQMDHAMDEMRYACTSGFQWEAPPRWHGIKTSPAYQQFQRLFGHQTAPDKPQSVHCGPGAAQPKEVA